LWTKALTKKVFNVSKHASSINSQTRACFDAKSEQTYKVGTPNFAIATIKGSNMVSFFYHMLLVHTQHNEKHHQYSHELAICT
jgi:hypothetical protein